MFADMTKIGVGSALESGWKVAYFRVLGWEKGQPNDLIDPSQPPVLEICLIPKDASIEEFKNSWKDVKEVGFVVPRNAQVIRVRAGDPWPELQDFVLKLENFDEEDDNDYIPQHYLLMKDK